MKRYVLIGLVCLAFIAPFIMGAVWDAAYELTPAVGDPVSEGDDQIRAQKAESRFRAEVEMCYGPNAEGCPAAGTGTEDNGRMREGSARAFIQAGEPGTLVRDDYDNTTGASGSGTDAVDDGRLWVDVDSDPVNALWVYDETVSAAWEAVSIAAGNADDEILAGAYNLIYNGSFEAVDGTGDETVTGACAALGTSPCPAGWGGSNIGLDYTDPTTDINYGEGFHLDATASAGNGEVTQILENLAANQTYKVIARAMDDGTTVCTLDTDGETGVAFAPDSTTTDLWETLSGTFTTGAAFEDVTVQLITVTNGQECLWDHVAVYRIDDVDTDRDEISQPGAMVFRATSNVAVAPCGAAYGGVCNGAATGLEVVVNAPGPGYIVMVQGSGHLELNDVNSYCYGRLYDGANQLVEAAFQADANLGGSDPENNIFLMYTDTSLVPGTPTTYSLDFRGGGATQCDLSGTTDHWLEAVLIPTR